MAVPIARAKGILSRPRGAWLVAGAAAAVLATSLILAIVFLRPGANGERIATVRPLLTIAQLESLAPGDLSGLPRASLRAESAKGMDVPAVAVDARYEAGAQRLAVKVVQSPQLERVVGFGSDASAYDRKSETGYQRRWREGDAIVVEGMDGSVATFGRLSNDVYIMSRGEGVALETLREAVSKIDSEVARLRGG